MPATPDIQSLFQAVSGMFLILRANPAFTIVAASAEYLSTTHTNTSIFGKALFDVFPDNPLLDDATGTHNLRQSLQRVIETHAPHAMAIQRYDLPLPQAVGGGFEERYWKIVNTPAFGENGEIPYIVNHVEEASAKHNRDAIKILESITEGFFTLDRNWRFDYVNQEAHRILQRNNGELEGKVLWEAYPGLEGTEFERSYLRTMREREKSTFIAYYPEQQRWYDVTTFPAPEGISVYFRDVTQQKQLEAERESVMRESERQRQIYETALNSTPDFVFVVDLEGCLAYVNEAMCKGLGMQTFHDKRWSDLGYGTLGAEEHEKQIAEVIRTGEPLRGEITSVTPEGSRVNEYIYAPVKNAGGKVVAIAGTMRDVTQRKAAEQALKRQAESLALADLAKDEFLATLSHELRNPLAPLRTAIEVLRRSKDVSERAARLHSTMDRQITHMVRLMDDLLEVSRISRGKLTLQMERVRIADVVASAVETTTPLMASAGHAFSMDLPDSDIWVEADPVRLTQILSNVLNNAAKYTNDGGHVELRVRRINEDVEIVVRDDGIGIPPEMRPRLFQMFSRGDRHSARNQGGLGIGLALSRRLAQMHGGTLEVSSDGLGTGSEFALRLRATSGGEQMKADEPKVQKLARTRILVIDDNRDAADTMEMMLETMDAEVRVAYDGSRGLGILDSWSPQVVLLDIGMPGINGFDVARAIRARHLAQPPLIVALTGWGQEDDRRRAEEAGFDRHLVKPVDAGTLQEIFASVTQARSAK